MALHREGGEVNLMRFCLRCVLQAEEVSRAQTVMCNRKEAIRIPYYTQTGGWGTKMETDVRKRTLASLPKILGDAWRASNSTSNSTVVLCTEFRQTRHRPDDIEAIDDSRCLRTHHRGGKFVRRSQWRYGSRLLRRTIREVDDCFLERTLIWSLMCSGRYEARQIFVASGLSHEAC
jgi:hypothetical protein